MPLCQLFRDPFPGFSIHMVECSVYMVSVNKHGVDIYTEGISTQKAYLHGADIYTDGTFRWRKHLHGGDFYTQETYVEAHIHAGVYMVDFSQVKCTHNGIYTRMQYTHGRVYTRWSIHAVQCTHSQVNTRSSIHIVECTHLSPLRIHVIFVTTYMMMCMLCD